MVRVSDTIGAVFKVLVHANASVKTGSCVLLTLLIVVVMLGPRRVRLIVDRFCHGCVGLLLSPLNAFAGLAQAALFIPMDQLREQRPAPQVQAIQGRAPQVLLQCCAVTEKKGQCSERMMADLDAMPPHGLWACKKARGLHQVQKTKMLERIMNAKGGKQAQPFTKR